MSIEDSQEPLFMFASPDAVHVQADGQVIREISTISNLGPEERKEALAAGFGGDPDSFHEVDKTTRAGRLSVGFSKWRSDWDPHANNIDPNLN